MTHQFATVDKNLEPYSVVWLSDSGERQYVLVLAGVGFFIVAEKLGVQKKLGRDTTRTADPK